jgi:hypothetical protein
MAFVSAEALEGLGFPVVFPAGGCMGGDGLFAFLLSTGFSGTDTLCEKMGKSNTNTFCAVIKDAFYRTLLIRVSPTTISLPPPLSRKHHMQ